jgi:diacylglycerol kinase (ATP)
MDEFEKKSFSVNKRIRSFKYAFKGIYVTFRSQHNFWIHLVVMALVIGFGIFLTLNTLEWLIIILCFGLVLSAEIFNSAIELLTDIVSPEYNSKAGLVKDMAAGAVLVSAIASAIIGLVIFLPKLYNLL